MIVSLFSHIGAARDVLNIETYDEKIVINGAGVQDAVGIYMSSCGDVNGDTIDDFVLGTGEIVGSGPYDNYGYILMGGKDFPRLINLGTPPDDTVIIKHTKMAELPVSGVGDFNGDGFSDVAFADILFSPDGIQQAGRVFLMFGGIHLPTDEMDFDSPAAPGVKIDGYRSGAYLGVSLACAGDVNHDGLGDLLMGAIGGSISEAFLIFGATDPPALLQISNLASKGVRFTGQIGLGGGLAGAGDVNGDGLDDFMIGAGSLDNQRIGHVYLIYGATDWPMELDTENLGSRGVDIVGSRSDEGFGRTMSRAGDVNGDGIGDVVFSSLLADANGNVDTGAAYLLFGAKSLPQVIQNNRMDNYGLTILGRHANEELGRGLAWAGDVNQDGIDDFTICSTRRSEANIVFGSTHLRYLRETIIDQLDGIRFWGTAPEAMALGSAAANLGDINGDGLDDLAIGDFGRSTDGHFSAGTVYIFLGGTLVKPFAANWEAH